MNQKYPYSGNQSLNNDTGLLGKKTWRTPQLTTFGAVRTLTQNGTSGDIENTGKDVQPTKRPSDRALKQNIVRVGEHPLGFGLYLFDYKQGHDVLLAARRQFGVMADEVEAAVPDAVSLHADGFKRVDYSMLGVDLSVQSVH